MGLEDFTLVSLYKETVFILYKPVGVSSTEFEVIGNIRYLSENV